MVEYFIVVENNLLNGAAFIRNVDFCGMSSKAEDVKDLSNLYQSLTGFATFMIYQTQFSLLFVLGLSTLTFVRYNLLGDIVLNATWAVNFTAQNK